MVASDRWPGLELERIAKGISVVMVKKPARGGAQAVRLSGGEAGVPVTAGLGNRESSDLLEPGFGGGQALVKVAEL